jgi:SAM-dependent methyltransferase
LDKKYWDGYYTDHHAKSNPTSFAKSIINTLAKKSCKLLEIGCGNGRDSFYFSEKGHDVSAFDQSEVIINTLQNTGKNSPHFFIDDVRNMSIHPKEPFEIVYARFVLHALNENEAQQAFKWIFEHLSNGGLFYSESRSINDNIFGKGEKIEKNIYKTDHRRRFLVKNDLLKELESFGFTINYVLEKQGLAVYKDSDPVVIRVIAQKP